MVVSNGSKMSMADFLDDVNVTVFSTIIQKLFLR